MDASIRRRLSAAILTLTLLASACGSDSKSSSTSAPTTSAPSTSAASAELCAAREDLRSSLQDLKNVDIVANGTAGLQAALSTITDNVSKVKAAASADLQPQVTAFDNALNTLGTAITNISSGGVAAVATAATAVATTGAALLTGLDAVKCS